MRRPRSKLEVSTFPFLAVLLCTMGALLLLLFIMDRRAKIAACYRVTEELQARQARTKAEEDARQSAWEKAKEQLHRSLLEQQNQLLANSKGLQENITDASQKLTVVQARHGELDQKIKQEATAIGLLQLDIDNQRAGLQQVDKKETITKAELADAAKELAELERAFQLLRALKGREKQTYSVVPYRGKRGDARPPIYVECVRDGVIFHPEKNLLQAWDFTPSSIIGEVERRHGPLAVQKAAKEKGVTPSDEPKGPYVLFLIRPDGIGSYYKAQGALKGYQLDFGYELVDADWALEFSGGSLAKNVLPGRTPVPWKDGPEGRPIVTPPPPGFGGNGGSKEGSLLVPTSPFPSSGGGNPGFGMGGGNPGSPTPPNGSGGSGNPFFVPPPTSPGNSTNAGVNTGIPFKPPTFVPISKNPPLVPIASSGGQPGVIASSGTPNGSGQTGIPYGGNAPSGNSIPGSAIGSGQPGNSPGGYPSSGNGIQGSPNGSGQPANPSGGSASTGTPNGLGQPTNPGSGDTIATSGNPNGSGQPANSPNGNASSGTPNSGSGGTGQPGSNSSDGAGTPGNGNSGGSSEGPAIRSFPPFGADTGKKPAPAPPLSRLLGNKDFIITIDCHNDYVTVNPGSLTYRWTATNLQATDQALTQTITNLIARRQASVRSGEPPYRPLIRFQVPSEGLRTYYHVYPILEHLKVPMTRENVAQ
jgi:hypothetical protein